MQLLTKCSGWLFILYGMLALSFSGCSCRPACRWFKLHSSGHHHCSGPQWQQPTIPSSPRDHWDSGRCVHTLITWRCVQNLSHRRWHWRQRSCHHHYFLTQWNIPIQRGEDINIFTLLSIVRCSDLKIYSFISFIQDGTLEAIEELDRETQAVYDVLIVAMDHGTPQGNVISFSLYDLWCECVLKYSFVIVLITLPKFPECRYTSS